MSASRTLLIASKSQKEVHDDYDSEEERYQWERQRMLEKVEVSASALRTLSEITRPYTSGARRAEREEKYLRDEEIAVKTFVSNFIKSKENKPHSSASESQSLEESSDGTDKPKTDASRRKSIWSPVQHVKTTDVQAVLDMEKTPNWRPLRKSKARQSLAQFNVENAHNSPSVCDDDVSSQCKPLPDFDTASKTAEDLRTPLRAVVGLNQALGRRMSKSYSFTSEAASTVGLSESDSEAINDSSNVATDSQEKVCPSLIRENSMESEPVHQPPSRSSSMDSMEERSPISRNFLKNFKSPVRYSPVLRQAFGEEFAKVRGSIGSPDKVVNLEECSSPKDPSKVLKGLVAYVEVRRGEDDRTGGFRWKLKQLGATVSDTLNKKVTHCVFQEGLLSTYRKAKQMGIHVVSPHWVMACDESFTHAQESRYPIEKEEQYLLADPLQKCIKRPKIMSPDLGSGRDEKMLSRRLQRRSVKINSPLVRSISHVIKTPSPVKTLIVRKNSTPSPKTKQGSDPEDDWDGFLAMVEAQVRAKAKSRRKAGEINDTPVDFETRLQQLLGRSDDDAQSSVKKASPPLASIFQKGKSSNPSTVKTSPKKVKKVKPAVESGASSSVMMNWLHGRSPETGLSCEKRDLSSHSAALAASAAADEILKTMFTCGGSKDKDQVDQPLGVNVTAESKQNTSDNMAKLDSVVPVKINSKDKKEPFIFTAKSDTRKDQPKKSTKNPKAAIKGNAAGSDALRNWLAGMKGQVACKLQENVTTLVKNSKSPKTYPNQSSTDSKKRKVESFEEIPLDGTECNLELTNQSKKHCGEVTPKRNNSFSDQDGFLNLYSDNATESPSKGSSVKKDKKRPMDLTPRRRSLRLTPVKDTSLAGSITILETVEESKESSFMNAGSLTPRKQPFNSISSKATPSKQSANLSKKVTPSKQTNKVEKSTPSKKSATPSKYTKSVKSGSKQDFTFKSSVFNAVFG